jgi:hypothetical protein
LGSYLDLCRTVFPEGAGYQHDRLELRHELAPEQRESEPANADSHLAFIGGGLRACVTYDARRPGPVYFVELDGTYQGVSRRRLATVVGFDREREVATIDIAVPVSPHPIDAINLRDPRFGLHEAIVALIDRHGVGKGRVRLELGGGEQHASLTINEYETLLMQHDLADVLRDPLRFAKEKARHAWNDPCAVPAKVLGYARYDLVQALNRLVDSLGLQASVIERIVARALAVPAARFLRMHRAVDLLVSDAGTGGRGALVEGTYQAPILIQWRPPRGVTRRVTVILSELS